MKRYIYLLIIGLAFLLVYHFFPLKESLVTITDDDGDDVLKVQLVSDMTPEEKAAKKITDKAKNAANAAAGRSEARATGSDNTPATIPPLSQTECDALTNSVTKNAGDLAKIPQQLQDAKSKLTNIRQKIQSNATQIQDASGIINKFVSERLDVSKKHAACAGKIPTMGKPTFKVNSNPINAAIQLFSGFTKST